MLAGYFYTISQAERDHLSAKCIRSGRIRERPEGTRTPGTPEALERRRFQAVAWLEEGLGVIIDEVLAKAKLFREPGLQPRLNAPHGSVRDSR